MKSRAQEVAEKIRAEKPNHNDANYISQLERQRGLLLEAIEQDTADAEKRVWHGPFRDAQVREEPHGGMSVGGYQRFGRCYIVEVEEEK